MVFYKGANAKPLIAERSGLILFRQFQTFGVQSTLRIDGILIRTACQNETLQGLSLIKRVG
jgi:hypothetical protein